MKTVKIVSIPIFSGDKKTYQNWKAAFTACVDNAPSTPECKQLQLRQCLAEGHREFGSLSNSIRRGLKGSSDDSVVK